MEKYQSTAVKLKRVFSAKLWQTICETLPIIVFHPLWGHGTLFILVMYPCFLGRILFPIMCMIGLYRVGKEIGACKKAAVLCFVDAAAIMLRFKIENNSISSAMSGTQGVRLFGCGSGIEEMIDAAHNAKLFLMYGMEKMADIVHAAALFLMVYVVCTSVAAVMKELGAEEIARFGQIVWKTQLVVSIFYMIVSFWPVQSLIYLSAFEDLVASVCFLAFVYKSYHALGALNKKEE